MANDVRIDKRELEEKLQEEMFRIGLKIERETKLRCPVDTGRLRASYTTFKTDDDRVVVGSPVDYAPHVEFGTVKMEGTPHLRPALDLVRSEINSRT